MEPSTKRRREAGDLGLVGGSEWSVKSRMPAWIRPRKANGGRLDPEARGGTAQWIGREGDDG